MRSTLFVVLFLVASATHLVRTNQVQDELDQVDFTDGESWLEENSIDISSLLGQHLDIEPLDGDISNQASRTLRRRRAEPGGKSSRPKLLTCPKEAAVVDSTASERAVIYIYRPSSKDEISISESKQGAWLEKSVDWLVNTSLQLHKPTLIYSGGWLQKKDEHWLEEAKRSLDEITFIRGEAPLNLIIFDWSAYNFMDYAKSAAMVPHLGKVLANFIGQLIDRHRYKADRVHLVSFSLSTHIAGLAGRQLQDNGRGKVAQITAIDPTGMCFHSSEEKQFDQDYSLRSADAKLVVARHYNMNQLGARRAIGGVDIFVNGGETQPRMPIQSYNLKAFVGSMGMLWGSHHRGVQHEASASLNAVFSDCHEVAYECQSMQAFKRGQCADCGQRNESCMLVSTLGTYAFGLKPTEVNYKPGTQMHLLTGLRQFCTYNYQIVARLKPEPSASTLAAFESGSVKFELGGGVDIRPKYRLNGADGVISFTALIRLYKNEELPERLGGQSSELIKSLESLSFNFMSNISKEMRTKKSIRYCPDPSGKLELVDCLRAL